MRAIRRRLVPYPSSQSPSTRTVVRSYGTNYWEVGDTKRDTPPSVLELSRKQSKINEYELSSGFCWCSHSFSMLSSPVVGEHTSPSVWAAETAFSGPLIPCIRSPLADAVIPVSESGCQECDGIFSLICFKASLRIACVIILRMSLWWFSLIVSFWVSRLGGLQFRYIFWCDAGSAKCPGWARIYSKQQKQAGLLHATNKSPSMNCKLPT